MFDSIYKKYEVAITDCLNQFFGEKCLVLFCGSFSCCEAVYSDGGILKSDIEFKIFVPLKMFVRNKLIKKSGERLLALGEKINVDLDFDFYPILAKKFIPNTWFWYEAISNGKSILRSRPD